MGRTPKGKPLTLRPVRLDDEVWAECQKLGKAHGTINEGLRTKLINDPVVFGDGSGLIVRRSEIVEGDYTKPGTIKVQPRKFNGPLLKPKERK